MHVVLCFSRQIPVKSLLAPMVAHAQLKVMIISANVRLAGAARNVDVRSSCKISFLTVQLTSTLRQHKFQLEI